MISVIQWISVILVGFSNGIVVGASLVALITVLGIVPRLAQITDTSMYVRFYQVAIVLGAVFWTWFGLRDAHAHLSNIWTIVYGLFAGLFIGLLAAALTEVLNVLPILAKRLSLVEQMIWLLMAIVFGKVLGSLFHWIWFAPMSNV